MTTTLSNDNDVTVHLVLTGASGYLGQHILSYLIKEGIPLSSISNNVNSVKYKITALYNRLEGFPDAVEKFRQRQAEIYNHRSCDDDEFSSNTNESILDVTVRKIDLIDPNHIKSFVQDITTTTCTNNSTTAGSKTIIVVVHTAAMSSPKVCEENPERAKAINNPVDFFDSVLEMNNPKLKNSCTSSIIALSTDQVYDGNILQGKDDIRLYKEDEKEGLNPVNVYGRTKLEMEEYLLKKQKQIQQNSLSLSANSSLLFALRSSIMLGPNAPIQPNGVHGTFLDFVKSRGEHNQETTFFINEYRNVVRVDHVLQIINDIITKRILPQHSNNNIDTNKHNRMPVVFNMGGPVRVNRMDMAKAVFKKFGYDYNLLSPISQTSAISPLDISMESSLLQKYGFGIGGKEEKEYITTQEQDEKEQQPATYLDELVSYVFSAPA